MLLKSSLLITLFLSPSPANADVIYTLVGGSPYPPASFQYVAPGFITNTTIVTPNDLASCSSQTGPCVDVIFRPDLVLGGFPSAVDLIDLQVVYQNRQYVDDGYDFPSGAFGAYGVYASTAGGTATLTVSETPEPATAILFCLAGIIAICQTRLNHNPTLSRTAIFRRSA